MRHAAPRHAPSRLARALLALSLIAIGTMGGLWLAPLVYGESFAQATPLPIIHPITFKSHSHV